MPETGFASLFTGLNIEIEKPSENDSVLSSNFAAPFPSASTEDKLYILTHDEDDLTPTSHRDYLELEEKKLQRPSPYKPLAKPLSLSSSVFMLSPVNEVVESGGSTPGIKRPANLCMKPPPKLSKNLQVTPTFASEEFLYLKNRETIHWTSAISRLTETCEAAALRDSVDCIVPKLWGEE